MPYAGVLPYCDVRRGSEVVRLYLLGLENAERYYDHDVWSDFGGGAHHPNDPLRSAAEEWYEESAGAFGPLEHVVKLLQSNGRPVKLPKGAGTVYLLRIPFDPSLPRIWNGMAAYFRRCASNRDDKFVIPSCPEGYFEKAAIQWFTDREILSRPDIRPVFRRSFKHILSHA